MSTATDTRLTLAEAQRIAADVVELLTPFSERVEIVGSIRRQVAHPSDIEVLCVPRIERTQVDLFGDVFHDLDLLAVECDRLRAASVLAERLGKDGKGAWGAKYKRALFRGVALDIFVTTCDAFGYQQVIRTGPWQFSKCLVTQQSEGGMMPFGMRGADGRLWRGAEVVPTPDEMSVFDALNLAYIEPWERT